MANYPSKIWNNISRRRCRFGGVDLEYSINLSKLNNNFDQFWNKWNFREIRDSENLKFIEITKMKLLVKIMNQSNILNIHTKTKVYYKLSFSGDQIWLRNDASFRGKWVTGEDQFHRWSGEIDSPVDHGQPWLWVCRGADREWNLGNQGSRSVQQGPLTLRCDPYSNVVTTDSKVALMRPSQWQETSGCFYRE